MNRISILAILVISITLFICPRSWAEENGFETMRYRDYLKMIRDAHLAYDKKNYEHAFKLYRRNACGGDKSSQFALGTMYFLGQGTQADGLKAYAWLQVAAESKEPNMVKMAEKVSQLIPAEYQKNADELRDVLLKRYGLDATHMHCKRSASIGSHIKQQLECHTQIDQNKFVDVKQCVVE